MPFDLVQHRKDAHDIGHLQDYLKQIVYGGNDGIVTTFAVVAGFAGFGSQSVAEIGSVAVLLFGIANILADGTKYLINAWWITVIPGLFLFAALLSLNFIGNALEKARNDVLGGHH